MIVEKRSMTKPAIDIFVSRAQLQSIGELTNFGSEGGRCD